MAPPPEPSPQVQVITPNTPSQEPLHAATIFLAGPTEVPWRENFIAILQKHHDDLPGAVTIYNPFQERWDSTWKEDYELDERFRAQTDWELGRMESSALIVVFFDQRSKAPVSLLELGLFARSGRVVVACEAGFWKRGNVQAVCSRLGVPLEETLDGLVNSVVSTLK